MTTDMPHDLAFLLQAANYGGGDGQFSTVARSAVDVIAEKILTVAEMQLKVARERLKDLDPAWLAAAADASGESL